MNGYFYIDDTSKQQCGPFTLTDLQTKNIRPETMVWSSGMTDWVEAKNVADLAPLFGNSTLNTNTFENTEVISNPTTQVQPSANQYNAAGGYVPNNNGNQKPQGIYNTNVYGRNPNNLNDVRPMPKNWMVESIFVTVLCCLPFGIAGIMSATKVESYYYAGDYDAALQASKDAKKWTIIGFLSVFVIFVLYILFFVILGLASSL